MSHFENDFKDFMRQQRAGNRGSARDMLRALGFLSLLVSATFWFPVQWELVSPTTNGQIAIALGYGAFVALGPAVFVSFFVPWSPAAQLLVRINAKTLGQAVALGCSGYLLYYAGNVLYSWWSAREVVAATNMISQQMIIGLIATIVTPALLWAPMSSEELEEILKQDQLVKRYELQSQLDIAFLQSVVLEAQRSTAGELAKIAADAGGPELTQRLRWLLTSMDQTIGEMAHTVKKTSGTIANFPSISGNDGVVSVLDAMDTMLTEVRARPLALAEPPVVIEGERLPTSRPAPAPVAPALAHPQAAPGSPRASESAGSAGNWREAYATAHGQLRGAWKRAELEQALSIRETQAGDYIRAWEQAGLVERLTEPKWHYRWTEEGAA